MAHDTAHGKDPIKRIWFVFALLSIVTIVEVILGIFLVCYLVTILLVEGDYIYEVYRTGHQAWDF